MAVERLITVACRAGNQTQAGDQVQDDHHHGVDRVPTYGGKVARPQQYRGNQDNFDQHNGQGQDQSAVGLAQLVGQVVGFTDHTKRGRQDGHEQHQKDDGRRGAVQGVSQPLPAENHEQDNNGPGTEQTQPGDGSNELS